MDESVENTNNWVTVKVRFTEFLKFEFIDEWIPDITPSQRLCVFVKDTFYNLQDNQLLLYFLFNFSNYSCWENLKSLWHTVWESSSSCQIQNYSEQGQEQLSVFTQRHFRIVSSFRLVMTQMLSKAILCSYISKLHLLGTKHKKLPQKWFYFIAVGFDIEFTANSFIQLNCGGVWFIYIKQIELDHFNPI